MSEKERFVFILTFTTQIKGGDITSEIKVFSSEETLCLSILDECRRSVQNIIASEGYTVTGKSILINSMRLHNN